MLLAFHLVSNLTSVRKNQLLTQARHCVAKLQQLAKRQKLRPIPVAGYFVASHPHDRDIRRLNIQNTPDEAIEFLRRVNPDVVTWKPFPGGCFDLSTLSGPPSPPERTFLKTRWDHSKYIDTIKSLGLRALTRMEDLQTYFDWAQFNQYDLLLRSGNGMILSRTVQEF